MVQGKRSVLRPLTPVDAEATAFKPHALSDIVLPPPWVLGTHDLNSQYQMGATGHSEQVGSYCRPQEIQALPAPQSLEGRKG